MKTVIITLFLAVSAYSQTAAIINAMGDLHIPGSYYGDGSHLTGIAATGSGDPAAYTTVTYSATPVFAVTKNTGQAFLITLTGDVSSSTVTTGGITNSGRTFIAFRICQDSGGSHAFVWPTNVLNHGTIDPTASACSSQAFWFDGTNFQAIFPIFVTGPSGGAIVLPGSTSGMTTLQPTAVASGTVTIPPRTATMATTTGSVTTNNCAKFDASGNLVDAGSTCAGGGGGTVNAVTATNTIDLVDPGGFTNVYLTWDTNASVVASGATYHSTTVTPSRFIADSTGVYQFCAQLNASAGENVFITKNHSATPAYIAYFSAINTNGGCYTFILATNDYIEVFVNSSGGATIDHLHSSATLVRWP